MFVASWNIAAINNNPFEYWITYDNKDYNALMQNVQFLFQHTEESPLDIPLSKIFTEKMYTELEGHLLENNLLEDPKALRSFWLDDYSGRKCVSEFLKDKSLGSKRILSMPDRTTNTFSIGSIKSFRPTVINCYDKTFSSIDDFWGQWIDFMFISTKASERVLPIKKSKYPALTEVEEKHSKPLSILGLALFDISLVHILNELNPEWQNTRKTLCDNLNTNKNDRIVDIIQSSYSDHSIIFLQEVAKSFTSYDHKNFQLLLPEASKKSKRDQNSAILLRKDQFDLNSVIELTQQVEQNMVKAPIADGDIFTVSVTSTTGETFVLTSFHGDTNGLATIPVLEAILKVVPDKSKLLFGFDANCYFNSDGIKNLDLNVWMDKLKELGLNTNYDHVKGINDYTCYNGRTFLQPQLNKAIPKGKIVEKGDVNQKDFIIFRERDYKPSNFKKDNTGNVDFIPNMVFPTLSFPSDHAVISCELHEVSQKHAEL